MFRSLNGIFNLVFLLSAGDSFSFASLGLTFELDLGTVNPVSRVGLDGAMIEVAETGT